MRLYERLVRPVLFRMDPELVHDATIGGMGFFGRSPLRAPVARLMRTRDPVLCTRVLGMELESPIGLTAGMDKQAWGVRAWEALGFGYIEVGSITAEPQPGNPKPRMWRLPEDKSIIVHLGLNSQGSAVIAERLRKTRRGWSGPMKLGVSLAKTKVVPTEHAAEDYVASFRRLRPYADFVVVNLSCPNVEGFTDLQTPSVAAGILRAIAAENQGTGKLPVLVKIGPDFSPEELDTLIDALLTVPLDGLIATNLRKKTRPELASANKDHPGGISGLPLQQLADETLARIARRAQGRLTLIGVGGVFTAEDAYRKIRLGASLVSLATGFIYGGPLTIRRLNDGLAALLRRDGFASVQEAVGADLN